MYLSTATECARSIDELDTSVGKSVASVGNSCRGDDSVPHRRRAEWRKLPRVLGPLVAGETLVRRASLNQSCTCGMSLIHALPS